jgi:hypothetical protein
MVARRIARHWGLLATLTPTLATLGSTLAACSGGGDTYIAMPAAGGVGGDRNGSGGVGGNSGGSDGQGGSAGAAFGGSAQGGSASGSGGDGGGSTSGGSGGDSGSGGDNGVGGGAGVGGSGGTAHGCEPSDTLLFFNTDDGAANLNTVELPSPPFPMYNYVSMNTFSDGTATPSNGITPPTHDGGGVYATVCSGIGFTGTGGGCRFSLSMTQNLASFGFLGIEFWARGTAAVNVRVNVHDGTSDYYGKDFTFDTEWKRYDFRFADLTRQAGNGPPVAFNASAVEAVDFRGPLVDGFEFHIDDLSFLSCP